MTASAPEPTPPPADPPGPGIHGPSLAVALAVMAAGTLYPLAMAGPDGHADHLLATLLGAAMAAGFVRGVGFVPRRQPWRALFSGRACALALAMAALRVGMRLGGA